MKSCVHVGGCDECRSRPRCCLVAGSRRRRHRPGPASMMPPATVPPNGPPSGTPSPPLQPRTTADGPSLAPQRPTPRRSVQAHDQSSVARVLEPASPPPSVSASRSSLRRPIVVRSSSDAPAASTAAASTAASSTVASALASLLASAPASTLASRPLVASVLASQAPHLGRRRRSSWHRRHRCLRRSAASASCRSSRQHSGCRSESTMSVAIGGSGRPPDCRSRGSR